MVLPASTEAIHEETSWSTSVYSYDERLGLCRLQLHSLELRQILMELVWCYKILIGCVHLESEDFFSAKYAALSSRS